MLRMEKSCTKQEKNDRVEEVLNQVNKYIYIAWFILVTKYQFKLINLTLKLNLKKCENTMIGSPEKNIKGISGGERRRLAFACEVIF